MLKQVLIAAALVWAAPAPASTLALDPAKTVVFREVVDDNSVGSALTQFAVIAAKSDEITLVIDSPGGYVDSGLRMITAMHLLQAQEVSFRCVVTGMAASMAFGILAECDERYAMSTSGLLFHPIRTGGPRSITSKQALDLGAALEYYEAPFRTRLIESMDCDDEWFWFHWYAETMHPGPTLAEALPDWIEITDGLTGIPMQDLLFIPQPSGLFGFEDRADPPRFIWITP